MKRMHEIHFRVYLLLQLRLPLFFSDLDFLIGLQPFLFLKEAGLLYWRFLLLNYLRFVNLTLSITSMIIELAWFTTFIFRHVSHRSAPDRTFAVILLITWGRCFFPIHLHNCLKTLFNRVFSLPELFQFRWNNICSNRKDFVLLINNLSQFTDLIT